MDLADVVRTGFEMYRSFTESHPLLSAMTTATVIFPTSDALSQLITEHQIEGRKVRYTAALSPLYGLVSLLCVESQNVVPDGIEARYLAQAALFNTIGGVFVNGFFFVNNTVGEKNNYHLGNLVAHYSSLLSPLLEKGKKWTERLYEAGRNMKEKISDQIPLREYEQALLGSLTLWVGFAYANFAYVPRELQTPSVLALSLGWTILLSAWSLAGRKQI